MNWFLSSSFSFTKDTLYWPRICVVCLVSPPLLIPSLRSHHLHSPDTDTMDAMLSPLYQKAGYHPYLGWLSPHPPFKEWRFWKVDNMGLLLSSYRWMLGYYRKWGLGYDLKHDVLCTVWSWGYKSSIETAFNCIDYSHLHATIFFIKSFRQSLLR